MSIVKIHDEILTSMANAIRAKIGESGIIAPVDMPSAINAIPSASVYAFIVASAKPGDTITVSNSNHSISRKYSDSSIVFGLPEGGVWLVSSSSGRPKYSPSLQYGESWSIDLDRLLTQSNDNNIVLEAIGADELRSELTFDDISATGISEDTDYIYNTAYTDVYFNYAGLGASNLPITVYGVVKQNAPIVSEGMLMGIGLSNRINQLPAFYSRNGDLYSVTFGNDVPIPGQSATDMHAIAISFENGISSFYCDGVKHRSVSGTTSGRALHFFNGGTNSYYIYMNLYYAACVDECESDNVIISNLQSIASHFNL